MWPFIANTDDHVSYSSKIYSLDVDIDASFLTNLTQHHNTENCLKELVLTVFLGVCTLGERRIVTSAIPH